MSIPVFVFRWRKEHLIPFLCKITNKVFVNSIMKFKKLNSDKEVNINVTPYIIKDKKLKNPSKPEQQVLDFLWPYWKYHVLLNQFVVPGSRLRCDLININLRLLIEISPESTHGKFNKFMHSTRMGYLDVIKRDLEKQKWAENNNFQFIELIDEDIENLSKTLFKEKFGIIL